MSLYPTDWISATLPLDHPGLVASPQVRQSPAGAGLAGGMVAVRVADLSGPDGSGVLVAAGGGPLRCGDLVAWCAVVAVTPVVVGPDGAVHAEGWLPDQVRLGVLEPHLGDGTVERVVARKGGQPELRQRLMSLPLVARLVLALALLPKSSYVDGMAHLVGLLPRVPWLQEWQLPGSTVVTTWRRRLGEDAMRELFWCVAGTIVDPDTPGARWHGLQVCAVDGLQVRTPDNEEDL